MLFFDRIYPFACRPLVETCVVVAVVSVLRDVNSAFGYHLCKTAAAAANCDDGDKKLRLLIDCSLIAVSSLFVGVTAMLL